MTLSKTILAVFIFALLLCGFWTQAVASNIVIALGGHIGSAFICFALLLAVLWFFGFVDWTTSHVDTAANVVTGKEHVDTGALARVTRAKLALLAGTRPADRLLRVLAPALLAIPYAIFAVPRHEFHWTFFIGLALLPVALSAFLEYSHLEQKFAWQDFVALFGIALILELRAFSGAWPYPGLGSLPKLYLADVALYLYLVVRRVDGVGYSFIPQLNDFKIGIREWAFFLPFALGLGFATHFIRFIPRHPSISHIVGALLVTFLLTAVPEELFFRGILQNLLTPRIGETKALILTACLFGLSHFHKGATFNWRYVIIAAIAGIFYGRAWRARRHLVASSLTHTLVDVVWGLWFR
jgi:membrane protease YdiL (CAAX protease family)